MFEKDEDGRRKCHGSGERISVFWLPRSGAETCLIIKLMADLQDPLATHLPQLRVIHRTNNQPTNEEHRVDCV